MIKRKNLLEGLNSVLHRLQGAFFIHLNLDDVRISTLVGLKVTSPNMEATANAYLTTAQTLDLAVMSNYGLDQADQEELEQIEAQRLSLAI